MTTDRDLVEDRADDPLALDPSLDLAVLAEARVGELPSLELLSPARLGIVCFRRRFEGGLDAQDAGNAALVRALAASGRGLVSSTRLDGAYAIRLCALNHASTAEDVEATLDWLATADAPPAPLGTARGIGRPGAPGDGRRGGVGGRRRAGGAGCRAAPRAAGSAAAVGAGRRCPRRGADGGGGGDPALRERPRLLRHPRRPCFGPRRRRVVRELGPGDFFGELAALDWGADYHYPRLATVIAATDLRLAKLTAETLPSLMGTVPAIDEAVRRVAAERLAVT